MLIARFSLSIKELYVKNSKIQPMQKQMITIGFHDKESPRYRNVCKEFIKEGYEIIECHTNAKGLFRKYKDLENQYKKLKARSNKPEASAILVTFPGFIIMPLAWFLTRLRPAGFAGQARPKLIFDAFVSISDTLVSDRGKFSWINPFAWFLYCTDVILCRMADEILIDTEAHKKFFVRRFFLSPKRIRVLHVGTCHAEPLCASLCKVLLNGTCDDEPR